MKYTKPALSARKYSLDRIAPQSRRRIRLRSLLQEFPQIHRPSMGFPDQWETCPIWKGAEGAN